MSRIDLTGILAFGTIGVVFVIAAVVLLRFLRKPQNRHPLPPGKTPNIAKRLDAMKDDTTAPRDIR